METSQVRVDLGARPARRDEVPLSLQLFVGGDDRAAGHPELGGQGPGTWQMVPRGQHPVHDETAHPLADPHRERPGILRKIQRDVDDEIRSHLVDPRSGPTEVVIYGSCHEPQSSIR